MQPTEKKFENVFGIEGMNIVLTRKGQNEISDNDEVVVTSTLELPCEKGYILNAMRFFDRVEMYGENLRETWGNQKSNECRYHTSTHKASTWKTAFENAEHYAFQEAGNLKRAIDVRNQALIDAEKDE